MTIIKILVTVVCDNSDDNNIITTNFNNNIDDCGNDC
jgi:hypothetical protein